MENYNDQEEMTSKLDELMEFLIYSVNDNPQFSGAVTFVFQALCKQSEQNIPMIRTILLKNGIHIHSSRLPASEAAETDILTVQLELSDFLYMYSGQASASEIAMMCMSGRVSVPWGMCGKLRAFADSFDFSTEKWNEFYVLKDAKQNRVACELGEVKIGTSGKYASGDKWIIVLDATSVTSPEDWELIQDCAFRNTSLRQSPNGRGSKGHFVFEDWLGGLCPAQIIDSKYFQSVQTNVSSSIKSVKTFFVSVQANTASNKT